MKIGRHRDLVRHDPARTGVISPVRQPGGEILRWWRRNDDFEWKEYVRTTVLVRRQERRNKIDAAKVAAVEGAKEAGRKGLAVGAAGAEAAGQAAIKIARSAAEGAAAGAEKGLALIVRSAAAVRSRLAEASEPINARLAAGRVPLLLAVVAGLAGSGFAIRCVQFGLDWDSGLLGVISLGAFMLWAWPRVFDNTPEAHDEWAYRTERAVQVADRAGSLGPLAAAGLFAAVALWFAIPVAIQWFGNPRVTATQETRRADAGQSDSTVRGAARAAGPGMLRIDGRLIRLDGLTLLDPAQTCRRADGTTWACGSAAKQAFEKRTRSHRNVSCVESGETNGVRTGSCTDADGDIGAAIVRGGHAFADGTLWARYSIEETEAREVKAGLWAGEVERPDAWRERLYAAAAAATPGGCPIKGRIQSGRKFYILPHSSDYARVNMREDRGERWFCSVEDAVAQGFAPRDK